MFMRMIYDDRLAQAAYLLGCQKTGEAIVIDPERDVDRYVALAQSRGLRIVAAAETHIHADFLSGVRELAERHGVRAYLSAEGGPDWTYQWVDQAPGGGTYDHQLLRDGDTFTIGNIEFRVIHTPGHTPEHIAFLVTDRGAGATEPVGMLSGDFLFVGDVGRPDLLETAAGQVGAREPSARNLYASLAALESVPDFVQVWPAHGAGSACGKALGAVPMSTIGYEKRFNPALQAARSESVFVDFVLSGQPEPPLYFANMKRLNKIGPPVLGGVPLPPRLTVAELRARDGARDAIIDTRAWPAFRAGHVPGALSIPLTPQFITYAGSFIAAEEEIVLVTEPGRVEEAVRGLIRIGLDRIAGWFDAAELDQYTGAGGPLAQIAETGVDEAARLVDAGQVDVLDVRRATEFAEGHLPAARTIAHTRLADRLDELPADRTMLVHCHSGIRSAASCSLLARRGFDVINLAGGMVAWTHARATVER
ncbi:MAG: rhodanese-like domain-containing protein [Planctomycetota bacterium]